MTSVTVCRWCPMVRDGWWVDGDSYTRAMTSAVRIGVLGGTFDPPHFGHLMAALEVRSALHLDRVVLMVAGDPWQKSPTRALTPASVRLEMTEALIEGRAGLEVSDLEVRRGGPSYMVDTLAELALFEPDVHWDLIVGADAANGLSTWHDPDTLARRCRIVVVDREGDAAAVVPVGFDVVRVSIPRLDISSSELRARVADGRPIAPMVPDSVCSVIERHRLYR